MGRHWIREQLLYLGIDVLQNAMLTRLYRCIISTRMTPPTIRPPVDFRAYMSAVPIAYSHIVDCVSQNML